MARLERAEAWDLLSAWTKGEGLLRHGLAVEAVMRRAAHRHGRGAQDEEAWGVAGLLHDADWEAWPDEHPRRIVAWLEERGEADIAHAVSAHYTKWGVAHESALDKALLACDELTGFVGACCHVRPGGIANLEPKSVLKRFDDPRFAAKVERDEVRAGARLLGVELVDHVGFVVEALRPHGERLGLLGRPT